MPWLVPVQGVRVLAGEGVSYNPYHRFTDVELIQHASVRGGTELETELATRLCEALDVIEQLEAELTKWNPWCRERQRAHDA